jgi:GntR family transcriptional regulator
MGHVRPAALTSFSEDMQRRGMRPGGRVLSLRAQFAGAEMCHRLKVSPREQVWSVRRLRTADEQPMAIEHAFLPRAILPDLKAADLANRSMYDHLRQVGVRVGSASQSIEPTVTSEEESELLDVPVLSPAFLFERTTRDSNGRPIEFVRSVYRGDRYRLLAELRPRFT